LEGELQKFSVVCRRRDVTPTMDTGDAIVDVTVKGLRNPRKLTESAYEGFFIELPQKTPLNSGHRFCGMDLEHTKLLLGLNQGSSVVMNVSVSWLDLVPACLACAAGLDVRTVVPCSTK
jgi:hypothetical protein